MSSVILSYGSRKALAFALPAALAMLATGCSSRLPDTYAGDLRPVSGTCDPVGRAVLTRRGKSALFAPQDGVLVLTGAFAADGSVTASIQTRGQDKAAYRLVFAGTLVGSSVVGTYVTPRCRYRITLLPH